LVFPGKLLEEDLKDQSLIYLHINFSYPGIEINAIEGIPHGFCLSCLPLRRAGSQNPQKPATFYDFLRKTIDLSLL
jgi:hypothetical protein